MMNVMMNKMRGTTIDVEAHFIGTNLGGDYKYVGSTAHPNGKIYYCPYGANKILEYDPITGVTNNVGLNLPANGFFFQGIILAPNGSLYLIPFISTYVYKYTPSTGVMTNIGTPYGISAFGKFNGSILATDGNIYCCPNYYGQILKINPTTDTISVVGSSYGIAQNRWYGGNLSNEGNIYYSNFMATTILKYNVSTGISSLIETGLSGYYGGQIGLNGKIYFTPYTANRMLELNTNNDTFQQVGGIIAGTGNKYAGQVLAPNGKHYLIPHDNTRVWEFDPTTYNGRFVGDVLNGNQKWITGTKGVNGKIYGCPFLSSQVLEIYNEELTDVVGADGVIPPLSQLATSKYNQLYNKF